MLLLARALLSAALVATAATQSNYSNEYMTCLVNKARADAGLPALGMDDALTTAAQRHSDDMARAGNMDHTGSDGSSPGDRCQSAGFQWTAVAENIAYGQDSMDSVMQTWMDSPGHRENILNPQYTMFGGAVANTGGTPYWTQDFACDGKPVRNVPTCDGNYASTAPTASAPTDDAQPATEAAYGEQPAQSGGKRQRGSKRQHGNGDAYGSGDTYGNDSKMSYGGDGGDAFPDFKSEGARRSGRGRKLGMMSPLGGNANAPNGDDDWFGQHGFGRRPSRSGSYGSANDGGSSGFGGNMFGGGRGFGRFGGGRAYGG